MRNLSSQEFNLRIRLREHVFALTQEKELRWKQRSSCRWLQLGDKNTKYFHAIANGRKNTNTIVTLQGEDGTPIPQQQVNGFLFDHFQTLLGQQGSHNVPFDLTGRMGENMTTQLAGLDEPITREEVWQAISHMPNGKSSGPDGLPVEFYKEFWEIIKEDLFRLVSDFHNGRCSIRRINAAAITLVQKKQHPTSVSDYRPISVINTAAKIITKVLANRLQQHLPQLIGNSQTAFVKGRWLAESFLVAREFLTGYDKRKIPAILYKVDFEKAFDTIDWCFLINLMLEKGFPPKWVSGILRILKSSTSRVKINGTMTAKFNHRRGLR